MKTITAADANRNFSQLLRDVKAGETITITSRGVPVATIQPTCDPDAEVARKQNALRDLVDHWQTTPVRNLGKFDRSALYEDE